MCVKNHVLCTHACALPRSKEALHAKKNESSARRFGLRWQPCVQAAAFLARFDARRLKPTCSRRDIWHTGARNPASGTSGVQPTRNLTHTDPPMHRFSTGGQNATHKKGRRQDPLQPSPQIEGRRWDPLRTSSTPARAPVSQDRFLL